MEDIGDFLSSVSNSLTSWYIRYNELFLTQELIFSNTKSLLFNNYHNFFINQSAGILLIPLPYLVLKLFLSINCCPSLDYEKVP